MGEYELNELTKILEDNGIYQVVRWEYEGTNQYEFIDCEGKQIEFVEVMR